MGDGPEFQTWALMHNSSSDFMHLNGKCKWKLKLNMPGGGRLQVAGPVQTSRMKMYLYLYLAAIVAQERNPKHQIG